MRNLSFIPVMVAMAALASSGHTQNRPRPQDLLGKPAPAIAVDKWLNTNGKPLSLAGLRGKVVVLDYWAHW